MEDDHGESGRCTLAHWLKFSEDSKRASEQHAREGETQNSYFTCSRNERRRQVKYEMQAGESCVSGTDRFSCC